MRPLPILSACFALVALAASLALSCAGGAAPRSEAPAEPTLAAPEPDAPAEAVTEAAAAPKAGPKVVEVRELTRMENRILVPVPLIAKETVYYPDGLVDEYIVYTYDASLRRLLSKATYDSARADPVEKVVSEYAADGRLAAELTYGQDGSLLSRRELAWSPDPATPELLVADRVLDAKGRALYSSGYEFDAAGRKSLWRAFDALGSLKATTSYSYDGAGGLAEMAITNAAGAVTARIAVRAAEDGSMDKRYYLAPDGSVQKIELDIYGEDGRLLTHQQNRADDSLAGTTHYSYGSYGERLSTTVRDGAGKVLETRSAEYAIREDEKAEIYYE